MADAPQVRDLNSLINTITAGYKPQYDLIDQQITANDNSGLAQRQALGAQQKQAFGNIEQGAQNKGMYFSGFSPDAQAKYTATTYLPALANLENTIATGRQKLEGAKVDLGTNIYNTALQQQQSDRDKYNAWQQMIQQQEFQRQQAEQQRAFEAQQNAANRAAQARASAAKTATGPQYTWKKNTAGGYDVYQGNKKVNVDLATAVASQGGGLSNLVSLLSAGSASDRKAADEYLKSGDYGALVRGTGAFYTGGGF